MSFWNPDEKTISEFLAKSLIQKSKIFGFDSGMNLYQVGMNLYQLGTNMLQLGLNLFQDRIIHTGIYSERPSQYSILKGKKVINLVQDNLCLTNNPA